MGETEIILAAEDLQKSFGRESARVHVLRGLSLAVRRGEFLAITGPSGCGKSTLLHVLGLMMAPDAGSVIYDGKAVGPREADRRPLRRNRIGFVFQRLNLLESLSARQNIAISLRVRGLAANGRIDPLLDVLGLADLARRKPNQMSIGQQQRLAIARALAHEPDVLLADEPTGNLDSENTRRLLELLRRINAQRQQTIVMITHSAEVAAAADRCLRMSDGTIQIA